MNPDRQHHLGPDSEAGAAEDAALAAPPWKGLPNLVLWTPSLAVLLLSGAMAGGVLGLANGAILFHVGGAFHSATIAYVGGWLVGAAGGLGVVGLRRALWGREISVEIGTVLGMLYGVVTDVVLIYRGFFLSDAEAVGRWGVAVAACFGGGIILGAILDRMTDALIAWWKGTPILGKRRS